MKVHAIHSALRLREFLSEYRVNYPQPRIWGAWVVHICFNLRVSGIHPQADLNAAFLCGFSILVKLVKRIECDRVRILQDSLDLFSLVCGTKSMHFFFEFFIAKPCFIETACAHTVKIPGHHGESSKRGIGL